MNRYYVRKFLNRRGHHGGAYIIARVQQGPESEWDDPFVEAGVDIADCGRMISLDFPLYSKAARSNSLYKARLLAEVTARFAEALEVQADAAAKQEASDGR